VDPVVPTVGHTHPSAAAARTAATNFANSMAAYTGVGLYIVGMSRSDQRKNLRGSRQWFWAKDTNAENRADSPRRDDIEYICDVDYYLDMPALLAERSKPTLLYTVVPETAASTYDDSSLQFTEDGALRTIVAGGGFYEHYLWNYASDSIITFGGTWLYPRVTTYAVERKQVAVNRQLVLLTPIKVFKGIAAYLAAYLLEGRFLTRIKPIVYGKSGQAYVRFAVHTKSETLMTTGLPGSMLCATIPEHVDSALHEVATLSSTPIQIPTVVSWIAGKEIGERKLTDRTAAVMLTTYLRDCTRKPTYLVFPVEQGVRAYHYEPRHYDQAAKPKLQAFMSPLVHAAYAPVNDAASERQMVKGRITDLRGPEPKPHAFRDQCMREYAEFVVQGAVLEPVCSHVVEEKQTRPAQKQSLARAFLSGPYVRKIVKCFIKAEAYASCKDPRNITTFGDLVKLEFTQFTLAFSEHCKQFAWYAPGKTPLEIAGRVADLAEYAGYLNISDYRRMDGTIKYVLRMLDRYMMMKAFPHYRAVLNEHLKASVDNKGYLPHGTTFDQGPMQGSGRCDTSHAQTHRAAFTSYLAYRHATKPGGGRYTPQEAFDKLGLHMGDDGLDPDLSPEDHMWAANLVGLELEVNIVQRGDRGVNFLARYYSPDVWNGCPDSMCDIKRQLSKFHTTVRLPATVTPEHKLVEKCMSYALTDGNTPVIGEFCKKALSLSRYRPKALLGVGSWWSRFDASVQYPNDNVGGWMDVELDIQFPEFSRNRFQEWLAATRTIKEILEPPLCAEIEPAKPASVDVIVDEQLVPAEIKITQESKPNVEKEEKPKKRARRPRPKGTKIKSGGKKTG